MGGDELLGVEAFRLAELETVVDDGLQEALRVAAAMDALEEMGVAVPAEYARIRQLLANRGAR